jgi:uncharacterized short protein YbdD (DUF466 family)
LPAEKRIKKIKQAIRGDESYDKYVEHKLMEEFSIGYNELMEFPYERYLEHSKILNLEKKEEKRRQERQEKKAK